MIDAVRPESVRGFFLSLLISAMIWAVILAILF